MNQKIIIANWKMNPQTSNEAQELFTSIKPVENVITVVCPPVVYIEELNKLLPTTHYPLPTVLLGSQDVFWEEDGAFTGEISTKQLSEFAVQYVLVGHSERRALGETDEMVNRKLLAVLSAGMKPVLLVGEKEKGDYRQDILIDQLSRDLAGIDTDKLSNLLVCYEPVWAISSHSGGVSDTPESALEAINTIKNILTKMFSEMAMKIPILYGGSVNASNIGEFLKYDEIAGAVVGSASLKSEEFNKILEIAAQL